MSAPRWTVRVLTLFPEMFPGPLGHSLAGKALAAGLWSLEPVDIRYFASDKHRSVDDAAFGGGPGLVMRPDVIDAALAAVTGASGPDRARPADEPLIYLSPRGRPLTQDRVRELAAAPRVTLLCGRYEGIDQRFIDRHVTHQISLGDFVLSGGEIAALALLDAVARLQPGVLGDEGSHHQDSFNLAVDGLLDCPHYTRPEVWDGVPVPSELLSGHHARIEGWRREQRLRLTARHRPDLIVAARAAGRLSAHDEVLLAQLGRGGPG